MEGLLKSLAAIEEFESELRAALPRLTAKPHTRLRPAVEECPAASTSLGYRSIEWVLGNLDSLRFGATAADYGRSVKIGMQEAALDRVVADTYHASTKTYENEVILGSVAWATEEASRIRAELQAGLRANSAPSNQPDLATFDSIRQLVFKVEEERVIAVQDRLVALRAGLDKAFAHAKPRHERPLLTHVFATDPTYHRVFTRLMEMLSCQFSPFARRLLLGIKNIQELYELYNFHRLYEILENRLGNPMSTSISRDLRNTSIHFGGQDQRVSLLYQPIIPSATTTERRGHFHQLVSIFNDGGLRPDYILVFRTGDTVHHAVLDAKYSTAKWVKKSGSTTREIAWKYGLGLAVRNERHKKADYVWTIFPGSLSPAPTPETILVHNNSEYYAPVLGSVESRPGNLAPLEQAVDRMLARLL